MRKKLWIAVILLAAGLVSQWLTVNAFSDNFREKAEKYIAELGDFWPFWKNKNPKIVWQTPFYDSDDDKPSYIEYKVSCDTKKDCWYVLVNIDGSDVDIPMSAFSWETISERMKNNYQAINSKNYYFWVFEQFLYDDKLWVIWYSNPENDLLLKEQARQSVFSKNTMSSVKTNPLKEKFEKLKKEAKENKEENVQKKLLNVNNKSLSIFSNTPVNWSDYWLIHNRVLDERICNSLTPCYNQMRVRYNTWEEWVSWCVPNAYSILFWFYEYHWKIDIVPGSSIPVYAPYSEDIRRMQKSIWELTKTVLDSEWWWTNPSNIINWMSYLKKYNNGRNNYNYLENWNYFSSYDNSLNKIKFHIRNGRPVLLIYDFSEDSWHILVVHWFIRNKLAVNFWHWPADANVMIDLNWNTFTSNMWWGTLTRYYTLEIL